MSREIGIMQGRLVPPVENRIQAFPADRWRDEFAAAQRAGLKCIEWIYDIDGDDVNPIASAAGVAEMKRLSAESGVAVRSLCADYFMPEPLLRGSHSERSARAAKLKWLLEQCEDAGIERVVLPFVDNSKIDGDAEQATVVEFLRALMPIADQHGLEIHLETSLPPERFAALLKAVDHRALKVNYDTGNSASLGYRVEDEFAAYGDSIGSIHIKDRVLDGGTVPLGEGNADFPAFQKCVQASGYKGDFILQVARSRPGTEADWAVQNRLYVERLLAAG